LFYFIFLTWILLEGWSFGEWKYSFILESDDFHKFLFPVLHDYAESRDINIKKGVLASADFA